MPFSSAKNGRNVGMESFITKPMLTAISTTMATITTTVRWSLGPISQMALLPISRGNRWAIHATPNTA